MGTRTVLLVVVVSVAMGAMLGYGYHAEAAGGPKGVTNHRLALEIRSLQKRIGALERGAPGRTSSPVQTYGRLQELEQTVQMLQQTLTSLCRTGNVVVGISQGSVQYATC